MSIGRQADLEAEKETEPKEIEEDIVAEELPDAQDTTGQDDGEGVLLRSGSREAEAGQAVDAGLEDAMEDIVQETSASNIAFDD